MSMKLCCDFCKQPVPTKIEDMGTHHAAFYDHRSTKEINTTRLFRTLCPNCAEKIDRVVVFAKDEWLKEIDIYDINSKINAARRELLGTKG